MHIYLLWSSDKCSFRVKRDEKAILLVDDRQEYSVKVRILVAEG
ncbi:MAG: hypothetical protein Q8P40_10680 [Nitrospirota bacterium]|nr:hypothetical protein [Nitrospirota bacterium]